MPWWQISRRKGCRSCESRNLYAAAPRIRHRRRHLLSTSATVVMGACVRRGGERLRPKALRRSRNRRAAAAGDLHHGKPAFVAAVGAESKQAVDTGKAGRVSQGFRRETL